MRIRYTQPALTDLEAILDYISAHSPQGAKRVQARIQAVIELLATHPLVGTSTDDSSIRRLPSPPYPYLIFYEAAVDEIIIHAIRHSARDPSSMPGSAWRGRGQMARSVALLLSALTKGRRSLTLKESDHKTPAEESSLRFARAGAEGATAPETLRPRDRSGMTLWKAIFHL